MHNLAQGWAEPDDPARRQDVQTGFERLKQKAAARAGQELVPDRQAITAGLVEAIEDRIVTNRADVVTWFSGLDEITRLGDQYVSVWLPGAKRAIRLKGAIYDNHFNAGRWLAGKRAAPEAERFAAWT